MSRRSRRTILILCALAVLAVLGPRPRVKPPREEMATRVPAALDALDEFIAANERPLPTKPDTEKKIVWAAGRANKTKIALVYLHGFSASRGEISPVVEHAAGELGANAFFARLAGHGVPGDALATVTARDWLEDAVEAVTIGRRIGEKVVVVGTSTGGTLATWLASRPDAPDAVVLVSPNFGPRAAGAGLLTWPWLSVLLPAVLSQHEFAPRNETQARLWTTRYPARALVPMMALVEDVRGKSVDHPASPMLFLYSSTDPVVDPRETDAAYARIPDDKKERERINVPAGEDAHVFAGDVLGEARTSLVVERIVGFVRRRLGGGG